MKIVKSLEESELLIKWISETIKNQEKEQKVELLPIILRILASSLWVSALTGRGVERAYEGVIRADQHF